MGSHSNTAVGQLLLISQHGDNTAKWNRNTVNYTKICCQHSLLTPFTPTDFNCLVFNLHWKWTQEVWVAVNSQTNSCTSICSGISTFTYFKLPFHGACLLAAELLSCSLLGDHTASAFDCPFLSTNFSRQGLVSHSFCNLLSCHRLVLHQDLSN